MIIYLVFKEVSDQYGKSELVKAFSKKEKAETYINDHIRYNRSYIKEIEVIES